MPKSPFRGTIFGLPDRGAMWAEARRPRRAYTLHHPNVSPVKAMPQIALFVKCTASDT
jgi:hypothetical protein